MTKKLKVTAIIDECPSELSKDAQKLKNITMESLYSRVSKGRTVKELFCGEPMSLEDMKKQMTISELKELEVRNRREGWEL